MIKEELLKEELKVVKTQSRTQPKGHDLLYAFVTQNKKDEDIYLVEGDKIFGPIKLEDWNRGPGKHYRTLMANIKKQLVGNKNYN